MLDSTPPNVFIIDDDVSVLTMVSEALVHHGMKVQSFSEGTEAIGALEDIAGLEVDLVLSDINMEGMDGFDVIHRVKYINPNLPVVLMTGQATLDYAVRAMRMGAANLFPKPVAIRELVNNVIHLVSLHRDLRKAEAGLRGLVEEKRHFSFRSTELDIPSMVVHLTDRLVPLGFARPSNVDVIAMAYHEALVNALEHGNLEMDSSLKGDFITGSDSYFHLLAERLKDPTYGERRIDVMMEANLEFFEVIVRDGGSGFDPRRIPRVTDASLSKQYGRGLAMIHMVMDEVSHNQAGNEIRMVLRRKVD
jgi:DNA-binding response OmpR family regulator